MFVTVCNKEYLIGFEVMLKSLIDNNPRISNENLPFLIISNELKEEDLQVPRKIHNNISLKRFDEERYKEINILKHNATAFGDYTKYEIFDIEDVDKIIFLDSDTLILGNIDKLIDYKRDLAAVRDLYIDQFNTGVMVIGKKYLKRKVVDDLIQLTLTFGITEHLDQDIINNYFIDEIEELSLSYNFLKIYHKQLFSRVGLPKHVKILHYVCKKPWQNKQIFQIEEGSIWQERYWFEYYSKVLRIKS
jgi:lipopolysaccharide biosynthesis glycosyltransferase